MFVFCQLSCISGNLYAIIDLRKRKNVRRVKALKDHVKVMLFLYTRTGRLIDCIGEIIKAKGMASFSAGQSTEACMEKMIEYAHFRNCLLVLREEMKKIMEKLTKEEKYLLEYKYFRRKRMLEGEFAGMKLDFSERTYFRRQIRLSAKLNGLFALHGLGEAWFEKNLRGVPYIAAALERMREGGKGEFSDKRAKTMLACQKTRRLPRKADERKEREISRATS